MIQLILYFIQLIFSSICLFVNKSSKNVCPSDLSDDSPASTPKSKPISGGKKKKPKRNRSAFIIFSSEKRAELKIQNGDQLNSNEMMVKLAELWRDLPEDEKRSYHEEAEREKVRYLHDLNQFYENNPNEIIQNKTKKNHVKKPCSAYALYLKETKKSIKCEHPDLKMADILKVVAQRWRELPENIRSQFQQKALMEKELTKAKMNEYLTKSEEPAPQKKKASAKKEQKSSKKSNTSSPQVESVKFEDQDHSYKHHANFQLEEPALQKRQALNISFPAYNLQQNNSYFAPTPNMNICDIESFCNEIQALTKSASQDGLLRNASTAGMSFARDSSLFWKTQAEAPQLSSMFSNDTIDLMNFRPYDEEPAKFVSMVKEEEEVTEDTHMSPRSLTGRITTNDLVMGLLDSESSSYDHPSQFEANDEIWTDFLKI